MNAKIAMSMIKVAETEMVNLGRGQELAIDSNVKITPELRKELLRANEGRLWGAHLPVFGTMGAVAGAAGAVSARGGAMGRTGKSKILNKALKVVRSKPGVASIMIAGLAAGLGGGALYNKQRAKGLADPENQYIDFFRGFEGKRIPKKRFFLYNAMDAPTQKEEFLETFRASTARGRKGQLRGSGLEYGHPRKEKLDADSLPW